jgi:hypothetical protein
LRKVSDSFTGIERGRMIRRNRLEQYIHYHGSDVSKQYHHLNKKILDLEKKYAIQNAKQIAELAAKNEYSKLKALSKDPAKDAKEIRKKVKISQKYRKKNHSRIGNELRRYRYGNNRQR